MLSPAMQDVIDAIRKQQQAGAGQVPATPAERRATFAPADRRYPVPADVEVTEVTAAGVPAHWLAAPGVGPGRVLVFLHGGGFAFGQRR
jgi:monoterpene epsilon-lactone hydrolase